MQSTRRQILTGAAALAACPAELRAQVPFWAFPNSYIDIDFQNQRAFGGIVNYADSTNAGGFAGSLVSSTGSVTAVFLPDATGLLVNRPTNQIRWTNRMGLWAFSGFTNSCIRNRDLTNAAWTAVNVTATKNQTGADGTANGATLIAATAILGTILQTITLASAAAIFSAYVKRVSGAGTLEITLDGTTWTTVSTTASYSLLNVPTQTLANPIVGFRIGTSGDSFAIDFCACNSGSSIIPAQVSTAAAAVTVANEEPAFNKPSGARPNDGFRVIVDVFIRGAPWSFYVEQSGNAVASANGYATDAGPQLQGGVDGGTATFGGATTSNTGTFGLGNWNRIAGTINGGGSKLCLNGGAVATGASIPQGPATGTTHCGIGNNGSGSTALNGVTRRIAVWQYELTAQQLVALTTLPA